MRITKPGHVLHNKEEEEMEGGRRTEWTPGTVLLLVVFRGPEAGSAVPAWSPVGHRQVTPNERVRGHGGVRG